MGALVGKDDSGILLAGPERLDECGVGDLPLPRLDLARAINTVGLVDELDRLALMRI